MLCYQLLKGKQCTAKKSPSYRIEMCHPERSLTHYYFKPNYLPSPQLCRRALEEMVRKGFCQKGKTVSTKGYSWHPSWEGDRSLRSQRRTWQEGLTFQSQQSDALTVIWEAGMPDFTKVPSRPQPKPQAPKHLRQAVPAGMPWLAALVHVALSWLQL